jgi:CO/xanthine dehydrogenase FAD-binding subunit
MRADPADYDLVAPRNLRDALLLLAEQPGEWLPIAGGTDVMVLYASGKLPQRKLVSVWNVPELRRIEITNEEIRIGAACTYTDIRQNEIVEREFPLLASAARWTGSIANQNRGTLGGNIVNASPAADSLPALLVYEADLMLVSATGEQCVPYVDFHTGYKKMRLKPDELIREIRLRRRFKQYFSYARKAGARNAQAISKVCLAAIGKFTNGSAEDVRIAIGSVAPVPLRLRDTERTANGSAIDAATVTAARAAAMAEIRPIDDIRSTAEYRAAVAGNLVAEFLQALRAHGAST